MKIKKSAAAGMRSRIPILLTGAASLLLYGFLTHLSRQFNWGEGYSQRPILAYLAVYFSLCALYGLAWFFVRRRRGDRGIFWIIIVFGLLFRAVVLPSQQIQEDDVYRYLWDGKVFANGINPFEYAPAEVRNFKARRIQDPASYYATYTERNERELERLDALRWRSPQSAKTLERVNHPDVPTVYPPMAQFVFRLAHQVKPDSIVVMRVGFFVFDIMTLAFLVGILAKLGRDKADCLIYFWSPLVIKETFNSTHLDIIGISLLCGSIYFLLHHRHTLATLFLAGSVLGKLYPLILFPLYLRACYEKMLRGGKRAGLALLRNGALFLAVIALGYLPFADIGLRMFAGLKTFATHWQSNDSVFAVLVFIFHNVLGGFADEVILSNPLPVFMSKVSVAVIVAGVLFWLLRKGTSLIDCPAEFIRGFFWIMALVFLLSPVQNPWYLCWVVPFLCIFPHRAWLVLTGLAGLYYLDFYFDYQELQTFRPWIPWAEYLPFYFLLAAQLRHKVRRREKFPPPSPSP